MNMDIKEQQIARDDDSNKIPEPDASPMVKDPGKPNSPLTDQHLISLLKNNSSQGLEEIYRKYHDPLCIYALKYINSLQDAQDVVQNVFVSLLTKNWTDFNGSLRSYLFAAVAKAALKQLRNTGRIRFYDIEQGLSLRGRGEFLRNIQQQRSLNGCSPKSKNCRQNPGKFLRKSQSTETVTNWLPNN